MTPVLPSDITLSTFASLEGATRGMEDMRRIVFDELQGLRKRQQELQAALQGPDAEKAVRALRMTERLYQEFLDTRLIDFLAQEHWLPSYAFPQDVLRLRVIEPRYSGTFRLERDAEYGISRVRSRRRGRRGWEAHYKRRDRFPWTNG